MQEDNKYSQTGSNPYYLNLNCTVKDFSFSDCTSPRYGLLDSITKRTVFESEYKIEPFYTEELLDSNLGTK